MRVDKARPEAVPDPIATEEADASKSKKDKKKDKASKKRKREFDVTPAVQLEGRKVKRGWTTAEQEMIEEKRKKKREKETKEKKSKDKDGKKEKKDKKMKKREVKSKYTNGPECLFKTKLPDAGSSARDDNDSAGHKKKKRRKGEREVVVHEFGRTVKHPSFLKANTEKANAEAMTFEDGVGWVDGNGTVIEAVVNKRSSTHASKLDSTAETKQPDSTAAVSDDDDTTSSSGSSSSSPSEDEDEDIPDQNAEAGSADEKATSTPAPAPPKSLKIETQALSSPTSALKTAVSLHSARPKSSGSTTSLTIKIPPATPAATKVHPLEALYKPPKDNAATPPNAEPFLFFDNDDIEEDADDGAATRAANPPLTPFTSQDFEYRNIRSAAPTPDTAHPSRTFSLWSRTESTVDEVPEAEEEDEEEDQDEELDDGDVTMAGTSNADTAAGDSKQTPASDFQKQFWESRGDLNRSWRRRKKTVAKEKRYRENRARAARAI
ncbi:hypothetical protein F5B20DRAFT_554240 [Whalleya microplaca]|nr:hypothetical protein F5B20DRAFT_554240 [Whalleya microplaca]